MPAALQSCYVLHITCLECASSLLECDARHSQAFAFSGQLLRLVLLLLMLLKLDLEQKQQQYEHMMGSWPKKLKALD